MSLFPRVCPNTYLTETSRVPPLEPSAAFECRWALLLNSPRPPKIPSPKRTRLPSNIPLRTLPSRSGNQSDSQATSLLSSRGDHVSHHQNYHHHRQPSDSDPDSGSESSWTDTGDIGEQLAEESDPVRLQLPNDIEQELLGGVQRRHLKHHKTVRILGSSPPRRHHRSHSRHTVIDKEAIEVPSFVTPPRPSRAQRLIGAIMSGGTSSIHGLTGKALL